MKQACCTRVGSFVNT